MFAVETHGTPRYVSGIFTNLSRAEKCAAAAPHRSIRNLRVKFPFYIIEVPGAFTNMFRYVTMFRLKTVLREIVRVRDKTHTYLRVYYICQEFVPDPDTDEMDSLPYRYVNNDWLRQYDRHGDCLILEMQ